MRAGGSPGSVADQVPERWLADEMLGRLARFLRILGCDTEYARDVTDEEIRQRALSEGRTLLTRDAALARQTPGAILLSSTDLPAQLAQLWRQRPNLSRVPRFDRCTRCNGSLTPIAVLDAPVAGVPPAVVERAPSSPFYQCQRCGQAYWEGSHTEKIRTFLEEASAST